MKPQLSGPKKRPFVTTLAASEASLSLQEELVAAIHGAFEVAVEIAVREVTELVGQATGDIYEEMRRENESLKQRLRRAEALLGEEEDDDDDGGGGSSPTKQPEQARLTPQDAPVDAGRCGGDAAPAADPSPEPRENRVSRHEEPRAAVEARPQPGSDAASDPEKEARRGRVRDVSEEISPSCVVKVESINRPCENRTPPLPPPNSDDEFAGEQFTLKQEKREEERGGSACCLDSIKVEDFSQECMAAVQSTILEEWIPDVQNVHRQDPSTQLSCTRLAQAHPPTLTTSLMPSIDLPSLSSEFPDIFQLPEPAPVQDAAPQVFGVHVRAGRAPGPAPSAGHAPSAGLYACRYCGQTFQLPSLLRRHHGQCQQKLQQRCPPAGAASAAAGAAGSRRTRLQLYPPGCSPFRCTECDREFNRMENLKTHLRIHTGERPYTCSVCSKCFRHSGALTRHFRIHTGEKPYVCGQCGKSFRNCGGLKFHQRSHSK